MASDNEKMVAAGSSKDDSYETVAQDERKSKKNPTSAGSGEDGEGGSLKDWLRGDKVRDAKTAFDIAIQFAWGSGLRGLWVALTLVTKSLCKK